MATDLAGRSVLVTGAASGIGRASALAFAVAGARVAAADINTDGHDHRESHFSSGVGDALSARDSQPGDRGMHER